MTATKRERMMEQIERHGRNLLAIFPEARERDPVKLCKKLRRLEAEAHKLSEHWCNGTMDEAAVLAGHIRLLSKANTVLGNGSSKVPIFVNSDPRGYAFKIPDKWLNDQRSRASTVHLAIIERDMGGYGIIAPDFSE